jgi:hypothetical protein
VRTRLQLLALLFPLATALQPNEALAQWRYPPGPAYPAYRYAGAESHLRVTMKPRDASVYVDGYFAGEVDDFDGRFQRLHVRPGAHDITIYREGYRSRTERLYLSPGATRSIEGDLEPLGPGETQQPPPTPDPRAGPDPTDPNEASPGPTP